MIRKIRGASEEMINLEWGTFDKDGLERRQKGACYICNGGYHYW